MALAPSLDLRAASAWKPEQSPLAGGRSRLRYAWLKAVERMESTPSPQPVKEAWQACVFARVFIRQWADWAERAGMQPAHLLSYRSEASRGLAWRWTKATTVLVFPRPGHVITEVEGADAVTCFTYRFEPDGGVYRFNAKEHAAIMKTQCQELERPTRRQLALRADISAQRTMVSAFRAMVASDAPPDPEIEPFFCPSCGDAPAPDELRCVACGAAL